jgi:4-amino-4-deoxy-L-arabinose transferase-like glycosyltransferase
MYRKLLLCILLGALAVRIAAGGWWESRLPGGVKFAFPDSEAYWELARAVAGGGPFELNPDRRVFRTPGYPALLAGVFLLASDEPPVLWARWLGAVLGVLAVGGVMALAGLLFDWQTALVAGAVAAVYPDAVAMSTFVLSEAPFCPLMLLQLCCWTVAWRAGSLRRQAAWALAGGLAAGLATLMRPSWLLFTPFAVAIGALRPADGRRQGWLGLWLVIGLAVAMAPWWFRNWQVTGRFVPTTLQVGESLYDGLNPQATGASEMRFVDRFRAELRAEDAANPATASRGDCFESRLDRRMRDAAVAWAVGHPGRVAQLAVIKFVRIWNVWPNEASLRNWSFRAVIALTYLPVLLAGLWGIWRTAGRGWPYVLCLLPAVYFTGLHMIFVGSIRYRQPALLVLLVPAAGMVVQWWRNMRTPCAHSAGQASPGGFLGSSSGGA